MFVYSLRLARTLSRWEPIADCRRSRHFLSAISYRLSAGSELDSRHLKITTFVLVVGASLLASYLSASDTRALEFKQFGLLAIQDGGRRKPVDTFATETLIRLTGRSTFTDKTGRKWQPNDFVLSALLETHDWNNEPMVLVSFGKLKEQLGLDKTQRRFSFTQLAGSAELQRLANEAQERKRAEKSLDRVQQEALSVSDRLAVFARVMDGSALLIIPASGSENDAWVDPSGWSKYYTEGQFAPVRVQLQTLASGYVG